MSLTLEILNFSSFSFIIIIFALRHIFQYSEAMISSFRIVSTPSILDPDLSSNRLFFFCHPTLHSNFQWKYFRMAPFIVFPHPPFKIICTLLTLIPLFLSSFSSFLINSFIPSYSHHFIPIIILFILYQLTYLAHSYLHHHSLDAPSIIFIKFHHSLVLTAHRSAMWYVFLQQSGYIQYSVAPYLQSGTYVIQSKNQV